MVLFLTRFLLPLLLCLLFAVRYSERIFSFAVYVEPVAQRLALAARAGLGKKTQQANPLLALNP